MSFHLRRLLLAGAFLCSSGPAWAEPVTLPDALKQGLDTSPRISLAKAKADAAEARARQAGVSPNPELSVELENFAGTGMFQGLRSTEATFALSQRIERGGKRAARVDVARAERDFAYLTYKSALADLEHDIRLAHANLAASEERLTLAQANVAAAQELSRTAQLLVEVGRDPPLRELRANALLAESKAEQARAEGEFSVARQYLAALIGSADMALTADIMLEDAPLNLPADTETLDMRLATAERDAARARIKQAQADAVPDVGASAGVRRISESKDMAFIAGISIPLPVRDRNRGNIEAAQADAMAAESGVSLAKLDASRARYEAWMQLAAAGARYEALAGPGLTQAEEALRLARIGYGAGKFSLIELLDAQQSLTQTKRNLIDARLDRARALAALIRAQAQ